MFMEKLTWDVCVPTHVYMYTHVCLFLCVHGMCVHVCMCVYTYRQRDFEKIKRELTQNSDSLFQIIAPFSALLPQAKLVNFT